MLPYLIAGAIGYAVAKLLEEDEAPKYADGGSVLLAPNGKPSNLNPEQYKLVRTPAFKKWFGDWENDPANASKVVDENGEPLVVFHGTNEQFNIFNKKGKGNRVLGYFFTTDKDFSKNYGESKLYFLNIKKIKNFNSERFDSLNTRENAENNYWQLEKDKLLEEMYNGVLIDRNDFFADINFVRKDYVAFEPNQIKLADGTNTTFDANNPDIRYAGGGKVNQQELIIEELKNNELLGKYLRGEYIGKNNNELYNSLIKYIPLKNKYPKIFKPTSSIFYRTDTILKTPELEYQILDYGTTQRDLPFIKYLSEFTPDLLENVTYNPKNKLQGWTSDKDFVFEHWYNVYVMGQGGNYIFDDEKYFSCVYILKDTSDLLFNEVFLDELREYFNGNGDERESLRLGKETICDVIVMNDI